MITIPQLASAQYSQSNKAGLETAKKAQQKIPTLKISSPAFKQYEQIPKKFTCNGDNVSPPLKIENIPQKTKSLALIVDDPGAPAGTFTHWLVWNISPTKTNLSVGEKNAISQGTNDFGNSKYAGPCPPSGTHWYFFKLYALDSKIDISVKSKKKDLVAAMQNHIIQTATLIGKYSS
jgi:Raf kinase inhibitor-like YbhB/YbcL family protein